MIHRTLVTVTAIVGLAALTPLRAADVSGKWQAEFDSPIGKQKYVYTLQVDGSKLTGQAVGEFGGEKHGDPISEGKIEGDKIPFVETADFGGNPVRIEYPGELAGDLCTQEYLQTIIPYLRATIARSRGVRIGRSQGYRWAALW